MKKYFFAAILLIFTLSINAQDSSSEQFRRDYNYVTFYDPETEEWTDWEEGTNTVVFNYGSNNDIKVYYDSGETEVFRKISGIEDGTTEDGEDYQIMGVLDENGKELVIQLYDNGNFKIIYPSGFMIGLSN